MALQPSTILGLGLCLGLLTSMQTATDSKPILRAEPGSEVFLGQNVILVCQSTEGVDNFRLENVGNCSHSDKKPTKGDTEAEFPILAVGKDSAGSYRCLYRRQNDWSERSEPLNLVVIGDTSTQPSGDRATHTEPSDLQSECGVLGLGRACVLGEGGQSWPPSSSMSTVPMYPHGLDLSPRPGLSPEHVYILAGAAGSLVLLLLLLFLLFFHRRNRKKQGPPSHAGKEESLEERVSPLATVRDTAGAVTADGRRAQDGVPPSSFPDAGDPPEEVTYAQLNHQCLTRGAAPAGSPQRPETESSMYATLARH